MNRAEKQAEIDFLSDCFTKTQIALCVDYRGLSVSQITQLRRDLRSVGSNGRVVKNTLARLSAERVLKGRSESEVERFVKMLEGPTLLIYSFQDPVEPTKVITKFAKGNDKLQIKGAFVDGSFVDDKGVEVLSKMPGREELLGQLLRLMNAPATNLVRLLQAPATQIVRVLDGHRSNLEGKAE